MKQFFTFLVCCGLCSVTMATSRVCLTLTNYSQNPVTLTAEAGPGYPTIAQPLQTITLPPDEMEWACPNDNRCSVAIRDNVTGDVTNLHRLNNGARIIYHAKNQYYIDPDANNFCQEFN